MKLVNKFKSPNYNNRKSNKIKFIIIHYTALKDKFEAISYLCDQNKKVSSHYLISQNGEIFNLVADDKRAWHAGLSFWDGHKDLNSLSIGIELDFSYKFSNNTFNDKMINSLKKLLFHLKKKYLIKNSDVLGHSDIAPYRKIDPGASFPWFKIIKEKFVYDFQNKIKIIDHWFIKRNFKTNLDKSLFILRFVGFDISKAKTNYYCRKKLILNYQSHYLQNNITGILDKKTIHHLKHHLLNLLLTKNQN